MGFRRLIVSSCSVQHSFAEHAIKKFEIVTNASKNRMFISIDYYGTSGKLLYFREEYSLDDGSGRVKLSWELE